MITELPASAYLKVNPQQANLLQNNNINNSLKGDKKEKLIEKINQIILNPPSNKGYNADIIQVLTDFELTQEDYLNISLPYLKKSGKTKQEAQIVTGYLFLMKNFLNLVSHSEDGHLYNNVLTISKHLGYEKTSKDTVIMRFGETGKKAYIILSGTIDVLIKTAKKFLVEKENYLLYLTTLIRYKEYEILNLVLNENFKSSMIMITDDINGDEPQWSYNLINTTHANNNSDAVKRYKASELLEKHFADNYFPNDKRKEKEILYNVSTNEYINRFNVAKEVPQWPEHSVKKQFEANIYSYYKVISLHTGDLFGDVALSDPLSKRTATIICNTNCHFGILSKNTYNLSLKQSAETIKRQALSFISSFPLFTDIPIQRLNKKYFNNFSRVKLAKGDYVTSQGEALESMYLLRKGEFEISMNASLKEITNIIRYIYSKMKSKTKDQEEALNESEKLIEKESKENPLLSKLYLKKNVVRISWINPPEIIGLPNVLNENKECFFNIQCKSISGEFFELSNVFYKEMNSKEYSIRDNLKEFLEKKYKVLVERLNIVRESNIKTLFDFQVTTQKQMKKEIFSSKLKQSKPLKTDFSNKNTDMKIDKLRLTQTCLPRISTPSNTKGVSGSSKTIPKLSLNRLPQSTKNSSKTLFSFQIQDYNDKSNNMVGTGTGSGSGGGEESSRSSFRRSSFYSFKKQNSITSMNSTYSQRNQSARKKLLLETSTGLGLSKFATLNARDSMTRDTKTSHSVGIKGNRGSNSSNDLTYDRLDQILRNEILDKNSSIHQISTKKSRFRPSIEGGDNGSKKHKQLIDANITTIKHLNEYLNG